MTGEWRSADAVDVYASPDLLSGRLRQGVDIWNAIHRINAVRKRSFDIVHAVDCRPNVIFPALYLKILRKTPLVLSWWDLFGDGGTATERSGRLYASTLGKVEFFFETRFRKFADYSFVVSSYLYKKLNGLGYPANRILICPVGTSQQNDFPVSDRDQVRKELGIDPSAKLLICAGTLFERDRTLLERSLREYKTQNMRPPPVTLLIGNHAVSPAVAKELNIVLKQRISSRDEYMRVLSAADFGLLPLMISNANNARWPSKASDFWSAGIPVISTPIGDFGDLFAKRGLGFLSNSDLPFEYAKAISFAVSSTDAKISQLKSQIREFVSNELLWSAIVRKHLQIFDEIVKADPPK